MRPALTSRDAARIDEYGRGKLSPGNGAFIQSAWAVDSDPLVIHSRESMQDTLRIIDEELKKFAGLVLSGNAFRGVSLNDCVLNATNTAAVVLPETAGGDQQGGRRG